MLAPVKAMNCNWLCTGDEVFPEMLAAIDEARQSVVLETYIYSASPLGERFREALIRACERGVQVRLLYDALGSLKLSNSFWDPLRAAGGQVKCFNPLLINVFGIRDHRKLLVCDERVAFVGGFNISSEYEGDGVTCGWCDLGLRIEGSLVPQLAKSFDEMFARANHPQPVFVRLKRSKAKRTIEAANEQLLLSGPGRGRSPIKAALRRDLEHARNVQIIVAYFLPTWRMRNAFARVAQRGGKVQFVLAAKSDVTLSQLAGQSLYRRFLKAGVELFEYQPQILHTKLIIIDDVVYAGSANLDQRSLKINYELLIRFENAEMAAQAREIFANTVKHSRQITPDQWKASRTLWRRLKQRFAYFALVRMDPIIAGFHWNSASD
jgi:cardiolipin synthase